MNNKQSQNRRVRTEDAVLLPTHHHKNVENAMPDRFDLLLQVSQLLNHSDEMEIGLNHITELMVTCWQCSFCRVFLLSEDGMNLETIAAYPRPPFLNGFSWQMEIGDCTAVSDWPRLDELLNKYRSSIIKNSGKNGQTILKKWSELLALEHDLQSQLVIPLRANDKALGLLELGQLKPWEDAPFSERNNKLAIIVAEQIAAYIDRMLLLQQSRHRERLLASLDETSRAIRAVKEHDKLLREVIRLAAKLVDCTMGGLYVNRPTFNELSLKEVYRLDVQLVGSVLAHGTGLIGKTAVYKTTQFTNEYPAWTNPEPIFTPYNIQTLVAIPLTKENGDLEAILFVADQEKKHRLTTIDIDILERLGQQAAIALQTSSALGQEARIFNRLTLLHRISEYIQSIHDLDRILMVILTGVTARYGLGFNRAVLLLCDQIGKNLVGRMGIGHFTQSAASSGWQHDMDAGVSDFGQFIRLFEAGEIETTPLETIVTQINVPISPNSTDAFSRSLMQQASYKLELIEEDLLPKQFHDLFKPHWPLAITPLVVREQAIGLIVVDNKFTDSPITHEDMSLLRTYANTAALGIDRIQLLQKTKQSRDYFHAFSKASNALIASDDPDQVWQTIMTQACEVAQANRVRMFLIDTESCWARDINELGKIKSRKLRSHSKAMQIMRDGKPGIIDTKTNEDEVGLTYLGNGALITVGLPVSIDGERIGVMWFYYDEHRHFPDAEIEALQLYVNQAAIAYENARRLKELTHMHRAAKALGKAESVQEVLYQIVVNACGVLAADSAAIFSYDTARNEFDPEYSVAYGIPEELWQQSQKRGPRVGGTAHTIFQRGWVGVRNVKDQEKYRFLGQWTQDTLNKLGVRSFQAIALKLGEEPLGVLYVNYNNIHAFFPEEQQVAQTFGSHAAQALRNAQLLSRLRKARTTASIVADVSTLANLDETLRSITSGLHIALHCDVVTVHVYNSQRDRWLPRPTVYGALYSDRFKGVVESFSLIDQMEDLGLGRLIVPDVQRSPYFAGSRFSRDEQIVACAAFRLCFGQHLVGALFVNYRQPHQFLQVELEDIELFANQAAVAIHNAQLYEQMQKRTLALKGLHEAGQVLTSSLDTEKILAQIAEQVCRLLNSSERKIGYTSIWLVEDGQYARVVATYPPEELSQTKEVLGNVLDVFAEENGRLGIVSRVIRTGEYELVENVSDDPDYIETFNATISELVMPIKSDGKVIGIINIEHNSLDAFDLQDVQLIESLASQAAVAIQNAALFRRAEEHGVTLNALFKAGNAIASSLDINEILNEIVKQAFKLTGAIGMQARFSCLIMRNGELLDFVAAYPKERLLDLQQKVGRIDLNVDQRFGVIGRAFKTGKPQLVPDVTEDLNYLAYDEDTRSELAVPIKIGEKVIGVINVEHPTVDAFDQLDEMALASLAGQAAVAIRNAEAYREATILQEVSEAFAGELDREETLKMVLQAAVQLTRAPESSILFWDEILNSYQPAYTLCPNGHFMWYKTTARDNGATHKIMTEQCTVVINDVLQDLNANPTLSKKGRRSVVGVPVICGSQVTAVLHVYSHEPYLFQEQQVKQLETLAGIAGVALTKVNQHEELKKTKGMVGSRTALAWMGMASNAWRHNIEGDAVNIRNAASLLKMKINDGANDAPDLHEIEHRLDLIHDLANQILERPITPPLSSEEGVGLVVINDLLRERTLQLWKDGKYDGLMEPIFNLQATDNVLVWASSEWLRRALDLVIDNAGDAMVTAPRKQLTIETAVTDDEIQIFIQDTGRGIPEDVLENLFTGESALPKREGHLGRGLLMVQAIIETYGGEVCVQATSSNGTVMLLSLPVAKDNAK